MADPASSIVTLATTTLQIVRKTIKFVNEAKHINTHIATLLKRLDNLRKAVEVVESTCQRVGSRADDPSGFVRRALTECETTLKGVRGTVRALASQKSESLFDKVKLKRKVDNSRAMVEGAIEDINSLLGHIQLAIGCWNVHLVSALGARRVEDILMQLAQFTTTSVNQDQYLDRGSRDLLTRKWSDATAYESDPSISSHRNSSIATHLSEEPVSPTSLLPRRIDSAQSNEVGPTTTFVKQNSDWVDFHIQIQECKGDKAGVEAIKRRLQQHLDGWRLAQSTDGSYRTPLHWAAQRGDVALAKILFDFGANINAIDSEPCSVLDLAVENNQDKFVEFLLEKRVDESSLLEKNRERFEYMKDEFELRKTTFEKELRQSVKDKKRRWSTKASITAGV